ncbi:MAG: hypothetical protein IKN30_06275 [Synergistaceae bacterium]|nr:hypothetical protein [Synergistaceae bacterium]
MAETTNTNTENVYVRQDVFNARMDRLEILIEKNGTELKAYVDNAINGVKAENSAAINSAVSGLRTEFNAFRKETNEALNSLEAKTNEAISGVRAEIRYVGNEVSVLAARVNSLENVVYWGLGGFGIILALAAILPTIVEHLRKVFAPSVTVEDVERIVNAAISKHLANSTGGRTA